MNKWSRKTSAQDKLISVLHTNLVRWSQTTNNIPHVCLKCTCIWMLNKEVYIVWQRLNKLELSLICEEYPSNPSFVTRYKANQLDDL